LRDNFSISDRHLHKKTGGFPTAGFWQTTQHRIALRIKQI